MKSLAIFKILIVFLSSYSYNALVYRTMQKQWGEMEMKKVRQKAGDPTRQEYGSFAEAFDFFNRELFGGTLPPCYITLQRKANCKGYYGHQFFARRIGDGMTSEIALNPTVFESRTDAEILSTLVHEQVHHWQFHFGDPGRGRYHNREWAAKMEDLGLMPSNTGQPGGKKTGQSVTHYIIAGGLFERACKLLLSTGFKLTWQARDKNSNGKKPGPDVSKIKHTCPQCGQNAWAKSGASLLCGLCGEIMTGADGKGCECPAYKNGQPNATSTPNMRAIVKKWRSEMTMLYHPDRNSGDDRAMKAINAGYDRLCEMFGV